MSTSTIYSAAQTVTVQFGNPSDTSGYRITQAQLLGERDSMCGKVYLVRDGDTFGIATYHERKEMHYCTNAMTLGREFRGHKFTAQDLSRHLGFSAEVFA